VRGSVQRSLCAAMLALQSVVLFLTGVVSIGATDVGAPTALTMGTGLAALCLVTAGLLRRPGGYLLGHAVQVVSIGLGLVVPVMFFLGAVFGALWVTAFLLGAKIDRERAERAERAMAEPPAAGEPDPGPRPG
jgi:hypothetical protein